MEPENRATSGRKFLVITLVVILAVVGVALGYLFMQKDTPTPVVTAPVAVVSPIVTPPRIYTEAEKRQILEDFAKQNSTSTTASEAEKISALKIYSTQPHTPVLSEEEKRKALEDFATQAQLTQ